MAETPKFSVKAVQAFFGRKNGQTLADFAAELKALTESDRTDIANGMANGSY